MMKGVGKIKNKIMERIPGCRSEGVIAKLKIQSSNQYQILKPKGKTLELSS
jgi:hypothetical protein